MVAGAPDPPIGVVDTTLDIGHSVRPVTRVANVPTSGTNAACVGTGRSELPIGACAGVPERAICAPCMDVLARLVVKSCSIGDDGGQVPRPCVRSLHTHEHGRKVRTRTREPIPSLDTEVSNRDRTTRPGNPFALFDLGGVAYFDSPEWRAGFEYHQEAPRVAPKVAHLAILSGHHDLERAVAQADPHGRSQD